MSKKGFTLVEVMIVVAIVAVLLAAVVPAVNNHSHFKNAEYIEVVGKRYVPESSYTDLAWNPGTKTSFSQTIYESEKYLLVISTGDREKAISVSKEWYYYYQIGDKYRY